MVFGPRLRRREYAAFCVRIATLLITAIAAVFSASALIAREEQSSFGTVERLLHEASQAKATGQCGAAYALLHQVVRIEPENSIARSQLGQIKVGREWLTVEESQRRAETDPRQAKYEEKRSQCGESPRELLTLARWCRGNKLDDEAQVHLASVLAVEPMNREALRLAQLRWRDGALKSFDQIRAEKSDAVVAKLSKRQWASIAAGWLRSLTSPDSKVRLAALEEIRGVDDASAIAAIEEVTLKDDQAANQKNTAVKQLSLAFLTALNKMSDEAATQSLVRYAVMSPFVEVRASAIADLRYRPLEDFVPSLVDGLAAPMKTQYLVVNDGAGGQHYMHTIYREGPFQDWSYRSERSIFQPGRQTDTLAGLLPVASSSRGTNPGAPTVRTVSRASAARSAQTYEQEIVTSERKVAEANEKSAALNERIVAVLTGTTDQSLGSEPRAWWDWWQDYTDYYRDPVRPVMSTVDTSYDYVIPPQASMAVECFVRGTPVWTKTGQRPIESLQAGDLVLSQDVNTGEIRYKAVLARTLRPAGPTVELETSDEKLRITRGHPLWVAGSGWRMTKELEDGAVLQTLTGTGRVEKVHSAGEAETYNLVVADFNTYFVGKSGILAHDNTPRRPTRAVLPGLMKK